MRRINANFDAAAYRQQMRSPEVAPVPGYTPDAALYATQAPVAVLEPPVLAPQPFGHVDFVPAPPAPTDTQVPAASIWTAPFNPIGYHEVEKLDPNAPFRPVNANKPYMVRDREVIREVKRAEKLDRKQRREAWIGRNAIKATTVLLAMSSVVAAVSTAGVVHNNLNQQSVAPKITAAPEVEVLSSTKVSTKAETTTTTTTTSTTTTTTPPTTQAPPTTEAQAPTEAFEQDFGGKVGNFQIPALCLNAEVLVYNADETPNVGNGDTVLDRLIPDPAPVDDCSTVNERVEPGTVTRADRVRPDTGHVNKYVPVMGFERLATGGYRHVYPCTTGTPENPVNTALPGHGSTQSAPNADAATLQPGDTAVFSREDGIECTYVVIDTEVVPFQGDDSHIIGYRNPNYSATMVTYGCSDLNGKTGSADGRTIVHWGLVGSEINPQISQ